MCALHKHKNILHACMCINDMQCESNIFAMTYNVRVHIYVMMRDAHIRHVMWSAWICYDTMHAYIMTYGVGVHIYVTTCSVGVHVYVITCDVGMHLYIIMCGMKMHAYYDVRCGSAHICYDMGCRSSWMCYHSYSCTYAF